MKVSGDTKLYTLTEVAGKLRKSKNWVKQNYKMWARDYGVDHFLVGNKVVMTEQSFTKLITAFMNERKVA
jgi:hypothetical protein